MTAKLAGWVLLITAFQSHQHYLGKRPRCSRALQVPARFSNINARHCATRKVWRTLSCFAKYPRSACGGLLPRREKRRAQHLSDAVRRPRPASGNDMFHCRCECIWQFVAFAAPSKFASSPRETLSGFGAMFSSAVNAADCILSGSCRIAPSAVRPFLPMGMGTSFAILGS